MTTEENTGAAKYRAKQRKLWFIYGAAGVVTIMLGMLVGYPSGYAYGMGAPVQDYVPSLAAWALAALFLVVFWATVIFAGKNADEVELQVDHFASSITLCFYMSVFLAWEGLYWLGAAPAVDARILFGATWAVAILAYLARRYWPR